MILLGLVLIAVGATVIAVPDSDDRLFSISRTHGPSALDAAGIAVVLAGWALLLAVLWRGRAFVRRSRAFPLGVALFLAGVAAL
ncbi:MAG: hypothetical protein M3310_03635, partial [Actinomycetota bacterium]|nr:hypothetical protein [Actinomycetota bacterium]